MSEIQHSEIIYEEGWRESSPVTKLDEKSLDETPLDEEPQKDDDEKPAGSKPLLITIQLVLCLLAALALFLLKTMDSDIYHKIMDRYHEELQKPIISQDAFRSVDLSTMFGESAVKTEATPDELPTR